MFEKPLDKTVATEDVFKSVTRNATIKFQLFLLTRVTKSEFVVPFSKNEYGLFHFIISLRVALLHYKCYDAYPRDNCPGDVHCKIMLVVFMNIQNCHCLAKCSSVITYVFFASRALPLFCPWSFLCFNANHFA